MIEWIKTGFLTSWQDAGRVGFARWGVPPGGPMDPTSANLAALLLHLPAGSPVVESYFPGPVLAFHQAATISITGADFHAQLSSGRTLKPGGRYHIKEGEVLSFTKKIAGEWVYIGFMQPENLQFWWGSVEQPVNKGEFLSVSDQVLSEKRLGRWLNAGDACIRFVPRPQILQHSTSFTAHVLPESNRMGMRLTGNWPPVSSSGFSSPVVQGTLQVLPNGQVIALMADHQTTGGYPVLGEIIRPDIGKLAQKSVGEIVYFCAISVEEAWQVQAKLDRVFRKLDRSLMV